MTHERERNSTEIRSTAEATDNQIGILSGHGHLLFSLQTDNRLVQGHVIQHRTERIPAIRRTHGQLDSLGDRCSKRSLMVGMFGQYLPARLGRHGRRCRYLGSEGLHDRTTVGFLLIADLNHIYGQLQSECFGRIGESRTPLSGTGFGRNVRNSLLFTEIGLCQCRIQLMRTDRTDTLVLEIDMCRSPEGLFQIVCTDKRGTPVILILFPNRFGDIDPRIRLVHLLLCQRFGKNRIQIRRLKRLTCFRVQRQQRLVRHIGHNVIPLSRNFTLRKNKSFGFRTHFTILFIYIRVFCIRSFSIKKPSDSRQPIMQFVSLRLNISFFPHLLFPPHSSFPLFLFFPCQSVLPTPFLLPLLSSSHLLFPHFLFPPSHHTILLHPHRSEISLVPNRISLQM